MSEKTTLTIETQILAKVTKVWDRFTKAEHITQWNAASDEWHTPKAINDLKVGGRFSYTMAAKDGSMSFDFSGSYTVLKQYEEIAYTLDDGRKVLVSFIDLGEETHIIETFEAESMNPPELQRQGWQSILTNFKKYVEG